MVFAPETLIGQIFKNILLSRRQMRKHTSRDRRRMMQMADRMDEKYWMFGYDLPAESRTAANLTEDDKRFLNTTRKNVWQQLRNFGCVPVQMSLWNVREPDKSVKYNGQIMTSLEAVRQAMDDWRAEYVKGGFPDINMDIWPMATNFVGANYIKTSQMRFVFESLLKVEKTCDEAIKRGTFKTRKYNDLEIRVEDMRNMFVEDFSTRHARWTEFEQIYMRVKRKMEDKLAKVLT
jgi:hypothetical protein